MSTHFNANVSLDSNANANVLGSHTNANGNVLVTYLQMDLISFQIFAFILTFCFILGENNVIYTNTLLIYLINTVVHYCNH